MGCPPTLVTSSENQAEQNPSESVSLMGLEGPHSLSNRFQMRKQKPQKPEVNVEGQVSTGNTYRQNSRCKKCSEYAGPASRAGNNYNLSRDVSESSGSRAEGLSSDLGSPTCSLRASSLKWLASHPPPLGVADTMWTSLWNSLTMGRVTTQHPRGLPPLPLWGGGSYYHTFKRFFWSEKKTHKMT